MRFGVSGRAFFDDSEFSELVEVDSEDIIEWACEHNSDDNGWLACLLFELDEKYGLSFEVKVTNCDDEDYYVGKFRPAEPQALNKDGSSNKDFKMEHLIWEIQKGYYEHCIDEDWAQDHIGSVSEHNEDDRDYYESMKFDEWKENRGRDD